MTTLTLANLRDRAVYRAQVVSGASLRHTPTIVDAFVNEALEEYHLLLTDCGHPQDVTRATATTSASTTVTLGWPANEYISMPSDFLSLLALRIQNGNSNWYDLQPFSEAENYEFKNSYATTEATGMPVRYRLANDTNAAKIARLLPAADAAYSMEIVYIPIVNNLTEGESYNFFPGTQDYVIADAAMRILEADGVQEPQQYEALMRRKAMCEDRLKKFAPRMNRAGPSQVQNTRRQRVNLSRASRWSGW